jgi:glutamyl-tRNA reductase
LAEENLRARSGNIAAARIILNGHLLDFKKTYQLRNVERAFNKLPIEIDKIRDRALGQVYKDKLAGLDPSTRDLIEEITAYMAKKCVAAPIKMAKETVIG